MNDQNTNNQPVSELLNLNELFARYGIDQLPAERKKEIEERISKLFEKRVALRIMNTMTEDQKKKAENVPDDELYTFLEREEIDFSSAMVIEATEFAGELMEYLSYIKGLIDGKSSE